MLKFVRLSSAHISLKGLCLIMCYSEWYLGAADEGFASLWVWHS